eukprot:g7873.t1
MAKPGLSSKALHPLNLPYRRGSVETRRSGGVTLVEVGTFLQFVGQLDWWAATDESREGGGGNYHVRVQLDLSGGEKIFISSVSRLAAALDSQSEDPRSDAVFAEQLAAASLPAAEDHAASADQLSVGLRVVKMDQNDSFGKNIIMNTPRQEQEQQELEVLLLLSASGATSSVEILFRHVAEDAYVVEELFASFLVWKERRQFVPDPRKFVETHCLSPTAFDERNLHRRKELHGGTLSSMFLHSCLERMADNHDQGDRTRRPAVLCGARTLSFQQLLSETVAFARQLKKLKLKLEKKKSVVGLWIDRDVRLPVAIWACVLNHFAYVPLDANDPDHRVGQMLKNCKVDLVVTTQEFYHRRLKDSFPLKASPHVPLLVLPEKENENPNYPGAGVEVLLEEVVASGAGGTSAEEPGSRADLLHILKTEFGADEADDVDTVMHIFHTSGTTGAPKGCVATRLGVFNYCIGQVYDLGLTKDDVFFLRIAGKG